VRKNVMQASPRMTRWKPAPSTRLRALEIIAAHPSGCTEAMLAAHDIPTEFLVDLVQSGLVVARMERVDEEDGFFEVVRLWISAAGELVAGRTLVAAIAGNHRHSTRLWVASDLGETEPLWPQHGRGRPWSEPGPFPLPDQKPVDCGKIRTAGATSEERAPTAQRYPGVVPKRHG